jgi:hypothetical protein
MMAGQGVGGVPSVCVCGEVLGVRREPNGYGGFDWRVRCDACGLHGSAQLTVRDAIATWERRRRLWLLARGRRGDV